MSLYTVVFYSHLASLALAAVGVLYADKLGFSWLRGKQETLQKMHLVWAHYLVSCALVLLILSGLYLFWPMRVYLLHQWLFYVKMAFVLALIVNSFAIGKLMHTATHTPHHTLSWSEKLPFYISGIVSMVCWAGAGVTALLLFYF
ncbi:MAG TPA: hypothetical protein VHD31_01375 [Candidatus Paceibacterota bacterium]|nr:hypothetical protein [Candidatus Paceibacterota bacterium]